ncbi:hypothetical protein GCM10010503_40560 [Streptomyces lucensis JCM 4490]|uniref:Trypsin-co-occurring domain-containing protein n=1 Tax=Streptomyces lucensis JCM 4490 TaxID=1306176 RepID=A0A918MTL4_9ACTN|nr:CU044_2847 family protein [Streptomyces lucensis]GGW59264.1 hypothetical protein GCM10010503_40560 [Streptomyces lucensis JCM 4490]
MASDGSVLRVEVDEADGLPPHGDAYEPVSRRRGNAPAAAADTLRQAVDRVRPAVQDVLASLRAMPETPDRVCLEFGVKLSADAGIVLARAATEAHFKVALEWESQSGGTGRADADDDPAPDSDRAPDAQPAPDSEPTPAADSAVGAD